MVLIINVVQQVCTGGSNLPLLKENRFATENYSGLLRFYYRPYLLRTSRRSNTSCFVSLVVSFSRFLVINLGDKNRCLSFRLVITVKWSHYLAASVVNHGDTLGSELEPCKCCEICQYRWNVPGASEELKSNYYELSMLVNCYKNCIKHWKSNNVFKSVV